MNEPKHTEPVADKDVEGHATSDKPADAESAESATEADTDARDNATPDDEDTEGHKALRSNVNIKHDVRPLI